MFQLMRNTPEHTFLSLLLSSLPICLSCLVELPYLKASGWKRWGLPCPSHLFWCYFLPQKLPWSHFPAESSHAEISRSFSRKDLLVGRTRILATPPLKTGFKIISPELMFLYLCRTLPLLLRPWFSTSKPSFAWLLTPKCPSKSAAFIQMFSFF